MSDVEMELGFHPLFDGQKNDLYASWLEDGEVVSGWNGAVAERISAYSPPALYLDGITNGYGGMLSRQDKLFILTAMPAMPQKLNGTDVMYIIAGDVTRSHPDPISLKNIALLYANGAAGVYAAYQVGSKVGQRLDEKYLEVNPFEPPKISRREFLAGMAAFTAIGAIAASGIAAGFTSRELQELGRTGQDMTKPFSFHQKLSGLEVFTEGRTALAIEKASFVGDEHFNGATIPTVLGTNHGFRANELLRSKDARYKLIGGLTKAIMDVQGENSKPGIIDEMSKYNLIKIHQPDEELLRIEPEAVISQSVQPEGAFFHDELREYLLSQFP